MAETQNITAMLRHELRKTQAEMSMIRARYEAAQTYPTNENHWAKADSLSPDAANDPMVRARLRSRSRFEVIENNPYLNGTLISLCNDFAGGGIRLRITDMDIPRAGRQRIEKQWKRWQKKIKLRKLLWQLRMDKAVSGEGFAVQIHNQRLKHPVKLDFRVVEADCVTSPVEHLSVNHTIAPSEADGIRLDPYGFPTAYHVLNYHPGGSGTIAPKESTNGRWIPAEQVIHIFRPMRSWHRGIPELTPSIPLCAVARRSTCSRKVFGSRLGTGYPSVSSTICSSERSCARFSDRSLCPTTWGLAHRKTATWQAACWTQDFTRKARRRNGLRLRMTY